MQISCPHGQLRELRGRLAIGAKVKFDDLARIFGKSGSGLGSTSRLFDFYCV